MPFRVACAAALILLAACTAEKGEQAAENHAGGAQTAHDNAGETKAAAAVPALEGSWRVTRVEGRGLDGAEMIASFNGGKASLATGCIRRAWTYRQDRNIVSFNSNPGGSTNCGGGTPGAEAETAYAALEQANIVIFAKDGKEASLSGTGGNLTLERR